MFCCCLASHELIISVCSSDFDEDDLAVLAGSADEDDSSDEASEEGSREDGEGDAEAEDTDLSDQEDIVEDLVLSSDEGWYLLQLIMSLLSSRSSSN